MKLLMYRLESHRLFQVFALHSDSVVLALQARSPSTPFPAIVEPNEDGTEVLEKIGRVLLQANSVRRGVMWRLR